jgi:hypothetical protein
MALTPTSMNRGTYILGGPGRLSGESATEAMSRGFTTGQTYRTNQISQANAQQQMQERAQAMRLRDLQEARTQQQFQAQQAAAARAAAQAARDRAALAALMEGMTGVGGASAGGATTPPNITPTMAPPRVGVTLPTDSYGGGVPLAYPSAPAPAPAPAPVSGGAGTPVLPGGSGADTLAPTKRTFAQAPAGQPAQAEYGGVPFAVYPDGRIVNTVTNTEIPNTEEFAALRAILLQQAGMGAAPTPARGAEDLAPRLPAEIAGLPREAFAGLSPQDQLDLIQFEDPTAAMRARGVEAFPEYDYQPTGQGFFVETLTPSAAAAIRARNAGAREAGLPTAVNDQVTAATDAEPPSPEAATAEAPTTAAEAAPVVEPSYGGLQLNFGTPVQLSFGEFDGQGSEAYVAAPERIFQDVELNSRQQQRLQLLATYYQQTNNLQGLVGVINQLDELSIEQQYLDGMTAIVGIQQENFGPVQVLLQQRYPGQQVEVRPYTDGTVEIFVDGQAEARLTWDDLATNLRGAYDRGFIAEQQALAEQARTRSNELWTLQTTEMLRGAREIAVANNQADINRLEKSGRIERIGETANKEVIFQTVVDGVPIQFVYREVTRTDPNTRETTTYLVASPVSNAALRP